MLIAVLALDVPAALRSQVAGEHLGVQICCEEAVLVLWQHRRGHELRRVVLREHGQVPDRVPDARSGGYDVQVRAAPHRILALPYCPTRFVLAFSHARGRRTVTRRPWTAGAQEVRRRALIPRTSGCAVRVDVDSRQRALSRPAREHSARSRISDDCKYEDFASHLSETERVESAPTPCILPCPNLCIRSHVLR
ncbi:hypothetical protein PLICRDRAFT_354461 [Plicaturopsis crispa FD-325 SS-3]|uniref:Uncharacterized protein n=1 Tax=Plicaturopsis crispa FD-325 SS-3 TaxID=944288 RepID=A0A0C9T5K1_PLICR|nr:hypothetical protein PLICRDRAFT_354461 [Plicaturopsis crispa FD-325 SS-3]